MIYTYEYDNAYFGPAMPIVEMAISAVGKQNRLVLRALVDSGADATMIPIRHLHRIGAKIVDRRQMRGSANVSFLVDVYAIGLNVGPYEHPALEVIGNRQGDDIIVGRDVLNQMIVTLNGLANVVELSQE